MTRSNMAEPESKAPAAEEVEDKDDVEEIDGTNVSDIASQVMKDPQVLAALQEKLGSMVGAHSGYIQSLPKVVKRRLKALKKLQFDVIKLESEFYKEVHDLECKYASRYVSMFDKRREILTGNVEPTDEECDWPSDDEKDDEDKISKEDMKNKAIVDEKKDDKDEDDGSDTKGIPHFWLTIFKNVEMLSEMVQEHDEPILQHLQDIKVVFTETEPKGYTLEFHFAANEYFTETILTKHYTLRFEPDPEDVFSYEGPEIVKCQGCPITWAKGKNVTVKTIKKKQKHKGRGTTRTVTKTVTNDSFFNFFNPPAVPDDDAEIDDDLEALLAADFEIGHFIRDRIVPRAALYFTGEALESDDYDDEGEEEEGEEEDYDEDNDADYKPAEGEKPPECKQQ